MHFHSHFLPIHTSQVGAILKPKIELCTDEKMNKQKRRKGQANGEER